MNHTVERIEVEAFECLECDFEERSVVIMMEHVIQKHTKKGRDNKFTCDDCDYKCTKRNELLAHFRNAHKSKANENQEVVNENDKGATNDLKEENRQLKNNFERLNIL